MKNKLEEVELTPAQKAEENFKGQFKMAKAIWNSTKPQTRKVS
jgi:hypothetical protein